MSMREPEYREIDGTKYVCRPLPGWEGVRLFFEMVSVLGEPAMLMLTRAFSEADVGQADVGQVLGAGMYSFFERLETDKGMTIMKIVFAEIRTEDGKDLGSDANFNDHFKGEIWAALQVFSWAMEVNFRTFLDAARLSGPLKAAKAALGKALSHPTSPQSSQPSASPPTGATH